MAVKIFALIRADKFKKVARIDLEIILNRKLENPLYKSLRILTRIHKHEASNEKGR